MRNSAAQLAARLSAWLRSSGVQRWGATLVGVGWLAALVAVLVATQFPNFPLRYRVADYTAGRIAERDIVVDRDFRFVDEQATRLRREARQRLVPPVYVLNDGITSAALERYDRFASLVTELLRQRVSEERMWLKVQVEFPGLVSRQSLRQLVTRADADQVLTDARGLLQELLGGGIVSADAQRGEIVDAGAIELWRLSDGQVVAEEVPADRLAQVGDPVRPLQGRLLEAARDDGERLLLAVLLAAFARENAFYDAENTGLHRSRAGSEIEPVSERLVRGQVLVRRGDLISEAAAERIKALGEYSLTVNFNWIVGCGLLLAACIVLGLYLLGPELLGRELRRSQLALLGGFALAEVVIAAVLVRLAPIPEWLPLAALLPTGALAMLVAILVSGPVAVILSLVVALALLPLTAMASTSLLFAFLSGVAGTVAVLRANRRIEFARAGLLLAAFNALVLAVEGLLASVDLRHFLGLLAWGALNGFAGGILALGLLPLFEHLLNAATRFRLMELADLNAPVFRRMLSRAPGTYTHSIAVANLAESACEAIGANALLARVAAYYHDIGKIEQAEYFIENQKAHNKHDELKPSLSAAVIKSHVRIGVEKARELNLPAAIVDLIAQHHGRGLITFFYHRAVSEDREPRVSREDYSYPGVRPRSREAAVLLLADTVEAASRTLRHPTEARLERFVGDTLNAKMASGELGDCGLTLRDMETIRRSFVRVLEGQYHSRIEYPRVSPRGAA